MITDYVELWDIGLLIAGACSILSFLVSLLLIYKHLRNFTNPELQKNIIRILLMVPIYACDSWLSLRMPNYSLVWDLLRDCYEGMCIYFFFGLIVNYVEGSKKRDVGELLETKPKMGHPMPLCCLPKIKLGRKFLRKCYQYILQFVIVKPFLAVLSVLLYYFDHSIYDEEHTFRVNNAYLWISVVANISITVCMYFLVLYYMAVKEELKPFKPVGKFLCVKAVIFFSFWQGVAISILAALKFLKPVGSLSLENEGRVIQDFLICIEMLILSVVHHQVFSYDEYRDPDKIPILRWDQEQRRKQLVGNIKPVVEHFVEVVNVKDVLEDTKESFLVPLPEPGEVVAVSSSKTYGTADGRRGTINTEILIIDDNARTSKK